MKQLFFVFSLVVLSISAKAQYPNMFVDPYGFQQRVLQEQRQQMEQSVKNFHFNFSNVNQSAPVQQNNNYNSESNTSTQQQTPQVTTRTCGVCHGTGKCNNCVNGWVRRLSGQDGPCPVCPNHNGLCSSCNGRGSWKE